MRHLDRSITNPPECLNRFKHGRDRWCQLTHEDRVQIWEQLTLMQGSLCAYCESVLAEGRRHIEHFHNKDRRVKLTFVWTNLLGCCISPDSCGCYKDSKAKHYESEELLDPSIEDPDDYFVFRSNGVIDIRDKRLSEKQSLRAKRTLEVLNLDAKGGRLRRSRENAVKVYLATFPDILSDLESCDDSERREFVEHEIHTVRKDPYSTPIIQLLKQCT